MIIINLQIVLTVLMSIYPYMLLESGGGEGGNLSGNIVVQGWSKCGDKDSMRGKSISIIFDNFILRLDLRYRKGNKRIVL